MTDSAGNYKENTETVAADDDEEARIIDRRKLNLKSSEGNDDSSSLISDDSGHLNHHLGFFPFKCKICIKSFTLRSLLMQHLQKVHRIEGCNYNP
uniref:C2H2-type domain-containing protein n=1 Tax=Glossina brevipalpis TaxID=37001 RepID=A0A1A9WT46_9MUSC